MKPTQRFQTLGRTRGIGLVGLLSLAGACHGVTTLEPVYDGCATDENWRTLDDYVSGEFVRIKLDAGSVPQWLQPLGSGAVSAAAMPGFSWRPSLADAGQPNGTVTCEQYKPTRRGTGPLHLPAVSGNLYDLHFSVGGKDLYRVMTTRQQAAVPREVWATWVGKSVRVDLYRAQLLLNDVADGGGPFQAQALTLTVTP